MSAQPSHLRALQPLNDALQMIATAPKSPPVEWWGKLQGYVRSARDQLIDPNPDPLAQRAEFLILCLNQATDARTYYRDGAEQPHAEPKPGQEWLFHHALCEIAKFDPDEVLRKLKR